MRPSILKRDRDERAFYCDLAERGDASMFYLKPVGAPDVQMKSIGPHRFLLRFNSQFQAVNPALRAQYQRHSKNATAHAQYWCHGDRPRPTLCVIHGFMLDAYSVNSRLFSLEWFYRQGYDILLYTLPFHGYRQGLLSPFSGHGYFAHGPLHVNESFAQAVFDFRHLLNWLEERGTPQFGVTGISLGGYTTALLASVEKRLSFAAPIVPPCNLVDVAYRWFPLGLLLKFLMKLIGIGRSEARHTLAVTSPLTWSPAIPSDRLLIIAAPGDAITYPDHHYTLHRHWRGSQWISYPGGHLLHFGKRRYIKALRELMARADFDPPAE